MGIDEKAHELAREFLDFGTPSYDKKFTITGSNDEPTGEEIVILVVRGRTNRQIVSETVKSVQSVATLPAGVICPMCGGKGSI